MRNEIWGEDWSEVRALWRLDPEVAFLNHGSFGACPRAVLDSQRRLRDEMEREPVHFLDRRLPRLLDEARAAVGGFLDADPEGLAFVPNATHALAAALASLPFREGDEVVTTDHAYPAVLNALERACAGRGASLRVVRIPLPLPSADEIVEAVTEALGPRARLCVIDHVTSSTAAIFPVERAVAACRARGVVSFVDAAHAPGMLPVSVRALDPDLWTGNLHKWVCAPKGAAVLWARAELRDLLRPAVTSHAHLTSFHDRFAWTGTHDPTAFLAARASQQPSEPRGWCPTSRPARWR